MVGHCSREIALFASIPDLENNFSLNVTHITPYSIMHSCSCSYMWIYIASFISLFILATLHPINNILCFIVSLTYTWRLFPNFIDPSWQIMSPGIYLSPLLRYTWMSVGSAAVLVVITFLFYSVYLLYFRFLIVSFFYFQSAIFSSSIELNKIPRCWLINNFENSSDPQS